jgi:uroporphyrinogen-III synthase
VKTKKVLVTWQEKWPSKEEEIAGFEFVQIPFSHIFPFANTNFFLFLKTLTKATLFFFSKAAIRGALLSCENNPENLNAFSLVTVGKKTASFACSKGLRVSHAGSATALDLFEDPEKKYWPEPWVMPVGNFSNKALKEYLLSSCRRHVFFPVYENREAGGLREELETILPTVDFILLSSPSAVRRLCQNYSEEKLPSLLAIGATTGKEILREGRQVAWQGPGRGYDVFFEALKALS